MAQPDHHVLGLSILPHVPNGCGGDCRAVVHGWLTFVAHSREESTFIETAKRWSKELDLRAKWLRNLFNTGGLPL